MLAVGENLVFILRRTVIDSAVRFLTHLPFEAEFEIVGNRKLFESDRASFFVPEHGSVFLDHPVALLLPAIKAGAIEDELEALFFFFPSEFVGRGIEERRQEKETEKKIHEFHGITMRGKRGKSIP
jgi:hypothetical protein